MDGKTLKVGFLQENILYSGRKSSSMQEWEKYQKNECA